MDTSYSFELEPIGMRRSYKSETIAKREARRQFNLLDKKMGGCCIVSIKVHKTTFNPYSRTIIQEYSNF